MTRDEAKAVCEKHALSGEPFTAGQLWMVLQEANGGKEKLPDGGECFRVADAAIQRLRKAGKISFARKGRLPIWTAKLAENHPRQETSD